MASAALDTGSPPVSGVESGQDVEKATPSGSGMPSVAQCTQEANSLAFTTPEECLQQQNVAQNSGLSSREVEDRRVQFGRNEFEEDEVEPLSQKFLEQVKDPMV